MPHPGRFISEKDPLPIEQEAGWTPGTIWTVSKNLASTVIRSQDRPARSESLYRLRYTGSNHMSNKKRTIRELRILSWTVLKCTALWYVTSCILYLINCQASSAHSANDPILNRTLA